MRGSAHVRKDDESEAKRLRALEEGNARLKRLVADLSVQNQILKELNAKNGEPVDQEAGGEDQRDPTLGTLSSLIPSPLPGAVQLLSDKRPGRGKPRVRKEAIELSEKHPR